MVFEIIQIFIKEVVKVKSMFDQISTTFNIKDPSPIMVLFLLKDKMVIGITNTEASTILIKFIKVEYKWFPMLVSIIQEDN